MNNTGQAPIDVSVVVVTFNSADTIVECLESIGDGAGEVLVVDNASSDSTCDVVTEFAQSRPDCRVRLISNELNLGYGTAANVGFAAAQHRYGLLINPDIRVTGEQIRQLRDRADGGDIVAPDVVKPNGQSQQKHLDRESIGTEDAVEVPWVIGAILLMDLSRPLRFDENFFLYFEETDLCRRAERVVIIPSIQVLHISCTSCGSSLAVDYFKGWHLSWSRHYFKQKYGESHSIAVFLIRKCAQYLMCIASPTKRIRYGSQVMGTLAWLRGIHPTTFTVIPGMEPKPRQSNTKQQKAA